MLVPIIWYRGSLSWAINAPPTASVPTAVSAPAIGQNGAIGSTDAPAARVAVGGVVAGHVPDRRLVAAAHERDVDLVEVDARRRHLVLAGDRLRLHLLERVLQLLRDALAGVDDDGARGAARGREHVE